MTVQKPSNVHLLGNFYGTYMILSFGVRMTMPNRKENVAATTTNQPASSSSRASERNVISKERRKVLVLRFNCYLINFFCYCISMLYDLLLACQHFFMLLSSNFVVRIQFSSSSVAPFISFIFHFLLHVRHILSSHAASRQKWEWNESSGGEVRRFVGSVGNFL